MSVLERFVCRRGWSRHYQ